MWISALLPPCCVTSAKSPPLSGLYSLHFEGVGLECSQKARPFLTSWGILVSIPLLPQKSPDCLLLFLEPWAPLAPGPRPAASRVLIFSLQCPLKGSLL